MRRFVLAIVLTALAAAAASGCAPERQEPPMFAVLDHTGSSAQGTTQLCASDLVAFASERYGGLDGARGEVRADLFDSSTVAAPTFPAQATFAVEASKQSNPGHVLEELAKDASTLEDQLSSMLRTAGPAWGGTDLITMLSSLGTAARSAGDGLIWICTDARDRRLPRRFDRRDVERVLRKLQTTDALPNLRGLDVVVDTITVRGRRDLTSRELAALDLFVHRLVGHAGGRLIAYGPTPMLER